MEEKIRNILAERISIHLNTEEENIKILIDRTTEDINGLFNDVRKYITDSIRYCESSIENGGNTSKYIIVFSKLEELKAILNKLQ